MEILGSDALKRFLEMADQVSLTKDKFHAFCGNSFENFKNKIAEANFNFFNQKFENQLLEKNQNCNFDLGDHIQSVQGIINQMRQYPSCKDIPIHLNQQICQMLTQYHREFLEKDWQVFFKHENANLMSELQTKNFVPSEITFIVSDYLSHERPLKSFIKKTQFDQTGDFLIPTDFLKQPILKLVADKTCLDVVEVPIQHSATNLLKPQRRWVEEADEQIVVIDQLVDGRLFMAVIFQQVLGSYTAVPSLLPCLEIGQLGKFAVTSSQRGEIFIVGGTSSEGNSLAIFKTSLQDFDPQCGTTSFEQLSDDNEDPIGLKESLVDGVASTNNRQLFVVGPIDGNRQKLSSEILNIDDYSLRTHQYFTLDLAWPYKEISLTPLYDQMILTVTYQTHTEFLELTQSQNLSSWKFEHPEHCLTKVRVQPGESEPVIWNISLTEEEMPIQNQEVKPINLKLNTREGDKLEKSNRIVK